MSEPNKPTDHDLLVRIDERVQYLERCLKGHLQQHWALTIVACTAVATAIVGMVVAAFR